MQQSGGVGLGFWVLFLLGAAWQSCTTQRLPELLHYVGACMVGPSLYRCPGAFRVRFNALCVWDFGICTGTEYSYLVFENGLHRRALNIHFHVGVCFCLVGLYMNIHPWSDTSCVNTKGFVKRLKQASSFSLCRRASLLFKYILTFPCFERDPLKVALLLCSIVL